MLDPLAVRLFTTFFHLRLRASVLSHAKLRIFCEKVVAKGTNQGQTGLCQIDDQIIFERHSNFVTTLLYLSQLNENSAESLRFHECVMCTAENESEDLGIGSKCNWPILNWRKEINNLVG